MGETMSTLMTIIGPLILLVLLVWAAVRSRRRHRGEPPESVTEEATRKVYEAEERARKVEDDDF